MDAVKVVALDSCRRGHLTALCAEQNGEILGSASLQESLATAIPRALAQLLPLAGDDLGAVVVVCGPGSYTGIRAGIAAALAVAQTQGVLLHSVDRLTAIAAASSYERVCAVLEAGRTGAYTATFDAGAPSPTPEHVTIGEWTAPTDRPVVSDGIAPFEIVDAQAILQAAIPLALARPASATAPAALYVSNPQFTVAKPRVS